jgi:hypothetical protein
MSGHILHGNNIQTLGVSSSYLGMEVYSRLERRLSNNMPLTRTIGIYLSICKRQGKDSGLKNDAMTTHDHVRPDTVSLECKSICPDLFISGHANLLDEFGHRSHSCQTREKPAVA